MLGFILVPAILAFAVIGAITWKLKCAVRWAVFSGIAFPVLFFGWLIYMEHARRAAWVSSHEPASKAGVSEQGFTVLRRCVIGTQQCVCYDAAYCQQAAARPGGAGAINPNR